MPFLTVKFSTPFQPVFKSSRSIDDTVSPFKNPFPVFHTILLTIPFEEPTRGYAIQIGVSIAAQYNGKLAVRTKDLGTWGNWNIIS